MALPGSGLGNYKSPITIKGSNTPAATLKAPDNAAGSTLHLVLEVTDQGTPDLTSFRRIVVQVSGR